MAGLVFGLTELAAHAQVINAKGASNAPLAVTTQATVLDAAKRRTWTLNWTDTGDLMCAPIVGTNTSPTFTPDSTHGFRMDHNHVPWTCSQITDNCSLGWSCVSTTGTVTVYSYEGF
jgi:hypothetical protein